MASKRKKAGKRTTAKGSGSPARRRSSGSAAEGAAASTGAPGASEAASRHESRQVFLPLPSGRAVEYRVTRRDYPAGRQVLDLRMEVKARSGEALVSLDGEIELSGGGRGPRARFEYDARKLVSAEVEPADVGTLLEEAARQAPGPLADQLVAAGRAFTDSKGAGVAAPPKVTKNGATLLRAPEGGTRAILHRATIAFDDGGGSIKPGWLVLVKHPDGGDEIGTWFVADEARSTCRGAGDVYEFALDGTAWIVGVPKDGAK